MIAAITGCAGQRPRDAVHYHTLKVLRLRRQTRIVEAGQKPRIDLGHRQFVPHEIARWIDEAAA